MCEYYDLVCWLVWLRDEVKYMFLYIYDALLSGFAKLIEIIPVPDFMANFQSFSMPPGVAYFADAFEIPSGIAIIVSAYIARFILRRLPVVG